MVATGSASARCRIRHALLLVLPLLALGGRADAAECVPPASRAAKLEHLSSMSGFAAAAGTTGGLDHPVIVFTSVEEPAPRTPGLPGSLHAALEAARAAGGGWITPSPALPAGTELRLNAPIRMPSNTTLDGGCQGITLVGPPRGNVMVLRGVDNAVITRFRMRARPENVLSDGAGDCIGIGGMSDRVWVAYNGFGRCGDGVLDVTQSVAGPTPTRVTVAFNHFAPHDKVMLIATLDCGQRTRPGGAVCPPSLLPPWSWQSGVQVTLQGNFFENTGQRHPRMEGRAYVHMRDNLVIYRPFRREVDGSMGASYGLLVGAGGRLLLDHGLFVQALARSGVPARAQVPPQPNASAGAGALRITEGRGLLHGETVAHALRSEFSPGAVPDPPYALGRPQPVGPSLAALTETARRCTGPHAEPRTCGHVPSSNAPDRPAASQRR